MKLKKIVSLALAGVLAVSMLTACGDKGSSSSSSEAPVATGLTGKVIAALDEDVTDMVTFTGSDSTLQKVLDAVAADAATSNSSFKSAVTAANLVTRNPGVGKAAALPTLETTNTSKDGTDSKAATSVFVVYATGTNEDLVAESLAYEIANATVYDSSDKIADLAERSLPDANQEYQYNFEYTGTMALVSTTDSATGQITYALAFTITRTPTKVEYKNV